MACIGGSPDPTLFPKLALVGEADCGRVVAQLIPDVSGKVPDIRVFAWIPKDRPDDKPIKSFPDGTAEAVPGSFRIYRRAAHGKDPIPTFEQVLRDVAGTPWSERFGWLETNGFELLLDSETSGA